MPTYRRSSQFTNATKPGLDMGRVYPQVGSGRVQIFSLLSLQ